MSVFKTERCQFLVENLNLERATGVEGARWEHFQVSLLNDDSVFSIEAKSRRVAWSWTVSAEAVAEAVLDSTPTTFVSINLEEAQEKIRYARQVFENLEIGGLPKLTNDNQLRLEFGNGARLISHPSKAPRGKGGNIVLDEFAHVKQDRQIYTGSVPVISKGGRLRIGSSCLGASGMFWEIFEQKNQKFPDYRRKRTPWWEALYFCPNVSEARKLAPLMGTSERVETYGTDRIKLIYANMPLEDFRQEYEAEFVDESTAWITWDEIEMAQADARRAEGKGEEYYCKVATVRGNEPEPAFDAINQVADWVRAGVVESVFAAGYDVGRHRNTAELFLVGLATTESYPLRLAVTLDDVPFDTQEAVIQRAMGALPVPGLLIDRNGMGEQLAENMTREFPNKARGVEFTMQHKKLWATDAKMLIQQRKTPLPVNRDISGQIHSIKRIVSASRNLIFDTERNQKHHADKAWAWMLALAAALIDWIDEPDLPGTTGYSLFG